MFHNSAKTFAIDESRAIRLPSGDQDDATRILSMDEIDIVSGGFVCGGLCIAAVAFGAGVLFGGGLAIGFAAGQNTK